MEKKSAKLAVKDFRSEVIEIEKFLETAVKSGSFSDKHAIWAHDYAIIRLHRAFENLIRNCLTAAISDNTEQLSRTTNIRFPERLADAVCNYIIAGDGYLNFHGGDGLVQELRKYLLPDHYLVRAVRHAIYMDTLDQLTALRDYAAHDSEISRRRALEVLGDKKICSAGAWLQVDERFGRIAANMKSLAHSISKMAPV